MTNLYERELKAADFRGHWLKRFVNQTAVPTSNPDRRWPHRVAVLLVCATFPLIWVGGLVTTYEAGMAVPDWPDTYGYNLFLYPWSTWIAGPWDLFIEHGHRLLAAAVGLITVALVLVTWRCDRRRWARWWTVACLGLVVVQGVLGGLRVLLNQTLLARIHGCVGPLFFVACVVAAAATSKWWSNVECRTPTAATASFLRLAWMTAAVAYLQLVLGAHLRHVPASWSPITFRGIVLAHLMGALLVTVHVLLLGSKAVANRQLRNQKVVTRPTLILVGLLLCQLLVGAATWRLKYQWPAWVPQPAWLEGYTVAAESMVQTTTVTAHVALGSLIIATVVLVALRVTRMFTSLPIVATLATLQPREVLA